MTPGVLQAAARRWLAQGRRAVEVQILSHRGSTPRETGTRMVVAEDAVLGTIGGGHLELLAITAAREGLREAVFAPRDLDLPLGPALGQCCGGRIVLRLQALSQRVTQALGRRVDADDQTLDLSPGQGGAHRQGAITQGCDRRQHGQRLTSVARHSQYAVSRSAAPSAVSGSPPRYRRHRPAAPSIAPAGTCRPAAARRAAVTPAMAANAG